MLNPHRCLIIAIFALGISHGAKENAESPDESLIANLQRKNRAAIHHDAAEARAIVDAETKNTNKFVDFALSTMGSFLRKNSDEIPLPERKRGTNKKFLGISFRAFANFYNGTLQGLQSIHRVGDAALVDVPNDDALTLAFDVELENLETKYNFDISLMGVGHGGRVSGTLKSIKVHLKLKLFPDGTLTVDDFDVTDIGMFKAKISGLGPFNYVFNGIGLIVGNLSKRLLLESLEIKLMTIMNEALAEVSGSKKRGLKVMLRAMLIRKGSEPITATTAKSISTPSERSKSTSFDDSFESS